MNEFYCLDAVSSMGAGWTGLGAERPIGVFDSGIGGLSVLAAMRAALPHEHLLYVADSAHAPYGDKHADAIARRVFAISDFLLQQSAKALVIACNTATGAAVGALRARYPALPIVAMEPAVKPALARTRSGIIGVLATQRTLDSATFAALLARVHDGSPARVLTQPCPGLVERIESGDLTGPATRDLLAELLDPVLTAGADTLVLGCTHYPHVRGLIGALAGPDVAILDSGAAVARQVRRRLSEAGMLRAQTTLGRERFFTTGAIERQTALVRRLWRAPDARGAATSRAPHARPA